jgi:hypothetical protein
MDGMEFESIKIVQTEPPSFSRKSALSPMAISSFYRVSILLPDVNIGFLVFGSAKSFFFRLCDLSAIF